MRITMLGCGGLLIFAASIPAQSVTDPVLEANPARPAVTTPAIREYSRREQRL
jgi:hypothetical protein